jgi:nicotinate-nucleotide adenylyltransferase
MNPTSGPTGLLGGTFDPPHIGHLLMGEVARVQLGLREVRFLPAGDPYHKARPGITAAGHRLEMVRLAVQGNPGFTVDDREVRREGATFTVDTLRELRDEGIEQIVLILGADTLASFRTWREPDAITQLATLAIAPKGHTPEDIARLAREAGLPGDPLIIDMPSLTVSSTVIRERLRRHAPVRYLVGDAVLRYIEAHRLYG